MTETVPATRKKASPAQLALIGVLSVVLIAVVVFRMKPRSTATTTELVAAQPLAAAEVETAASSAAASEVSTEPPLATKGVQPDRKPVIVDLAQLGRTNPFRGFADGAAARRGDVSGGGESATLAASENESGTSDETHDDSMLLRLSEGAGNLRVSAIMGSGPNRAALIGDKVVRPGDLLDERLQVVAIHRDRVEIAAATESE